jgi:hypothetical protein
MFINPEEPMTEFGNKIKLAILKMDNTISSQCPVCGKNLDTYIDTLKEEISFKCKTNTCIVSNDYWFLSADDFLNLDFKSLAKKQLELDKEYGG